jgi:regulator of cell morphogenesis and NO signaling
MTIQKSDTIGDIVASNVNAAFVFNFYDVDFYSQGERTLEDACIEQNLPILTIIEELYGLDTGGAELPDFRHMKLKELSTYILRTHHKYTEKKLVYIKHTLDKLISFYGEDYPNLAKVKKVFDHLSVYLTVHMKHEEFVIFPSINQIEKNQRKPVDPTTIQRPIFSMREDHDHEVSTLRTLAELTANYTAPRNSDYTFKITYNAMRELAEDLKIHMHLENNILFPTAMKIACDIHQNLN